MSNNEPASLWFVFRSPDDGPLSRRLRRLNIAAMPGHEDPDPALLLWFQRQIGLARASADPDRIAEDALGGHSGGLGAVFEAVKAKRLPIPKTLAALERMLRVHLAVPGGEDHIRITDHTLRVLTQDNGVPVAFYFFDDEVVRTQPDRVAFLMLEDLNLPDGTGAGAFRNPVKAAALSPAGTGAGSTFACLFTARTGQTPPGQVVAFAGVRLPDLATHLRDATPTDEALAAWPPELRLLRDKLTPADKFLSTALGRCGAETLVHEGEHVATACVRPAADAGFQQWILFDDRWAATHPDLAASILRAATDWDPFVWRKPKKKTAKESAADTLHRAWSRGVGDRTEADAQPYQLSARYAVGTLLQHAHFGLGTVESIDGSKIQVVFQDARRTLIHGKTA